MIDDHNIASPLLRIQAPISRSLSLHNNPRSFSTESHAAKGLTSHISRSSYWSYKYYVRTPCYTCGIKYRSHERANLVIRCVFDYCIFPSQITENTGKPHRGSKIPAPSLKALSSLPCSAMHSPDTDRQGPLRTAVDQFFSSSFCSQIRS